MKNVNPSPGSASHRASHRPWLLGSGLAVAVIAAIKLALHLYAGRQYGYFVDELYYMACARNLHWGYVDHPPLIALVTWIEMALFGDSLSAVRFLPALAGAAQVILAGLMARELGGRERAQALAALCVLLAPGNLALGHFLTMNAFEPLFWTGCALLAIRIVKGGSARLWLWFGLLAGVGLENKYSMAIFGLGIVLGLLLTEQRRVLRTKWLWIGGAIAFLILLPNLLWNVHNHFPFLEFERNIARSGRNVALPPLKFLGEEALAMLPLSLPVWLGGLWFFFARREGREFRFLGWAWLASAAIILMVSPRVYYLFPAFPVLFAGGGVLWEQWLEGWRARWVVPVYATLMGAMAALLAPTVIPLLPPEDYIRYAAATHLEQPRVETHRLGPMPQLFADQFGWEEMAAAVAQAYNSLPPEVRAKTAIFGQNYGQAGAIDFFGRRYGLPPALSGHQSYFLWGPRGYTGESIIVLGDRREVLERKFASVRFVAHVGHPYAMPYQHFDVFYCQGLKWPLGEVWPKLKNWD